MNTKEKILSLLKYIFVIGIFNISLGFIIPTIINLFNLEEELNVCTKNIQNLFLYKNVFGNQWNIQILFGLLYIIIYVKMYIDIKINNTYIEIFNLFKNKHYIMLIYFISFVQIIFGISVGPFLIDAYSAPFRMSIGVSTENFNAYASYMRLLRIFWIYSAIPGVIIFILTYRLSKIIKKNVSI